MLWFLGWMKFNLSILEHYFLTSLNESSLAIEMVFATVHNTKYTKLAVNNYQ